MALYALDGAMDYARTVLSGLKDLATLIHEDIVLTEIDIENLIRTKGAIYAGCKVLLDSVGLGFKDLEQLYIIARRLAEFVCPSEYGMTRKQV